MTLRTTKGMNLIVMVIVVIFDVVIAVLLGKQTDDFRMSNVWLLVLYAHLLGLTPWIYVVLERWRQQPIRSQRLRKLLGISCDVAHFHQMNTLAHNVVWSVVDALHLRSAALYLKEGDQYNLMAAWKPGEDWKEQIPKILPAITPVVQELKESLRKHKESSLHKPILIRERFTFNKNDLVKSMDYLEAEMIVAFGQNPYGVKSGHWTNWLRLW